VRSTFAFLISAKDVTHIGFDEPRSTNEADEVVVNKSGVCRHRNEWRVVAPLASGVASAATPNTLDLNVLLIGGVTPSPTTAAWQSALSSEGVAYTLVAPSGATVPRR